MLLVSGFEFVGNYKILQTAFTKLKIDRHIDVDRLKEGKYMDNLEFMQWFKRFFELGIGERPESYDAISARKKGKGGEKLGGVYKNVVSTKKETQQTRTTSAPAGTKRSNANEGKKENNHNALNRNATSGDKLLHKQTPSSPTSAARISSSAAITANKALVVEVATLKAAIAQKDEDTISSKHELDGLEKERDFYFDKLRDIEILLQDLEEKKEEEKNSNDEEVTSISSAIFKILYQTADGFVQSPNHTSPKHQSFTSKSPSSSGTHSSSEVQAVIEEKEVPFQLANSGLLSDEEDD